MPTEFDLKVYSLLKKVPKGNVTTYRDLAHQLGTRAYRAVGSALKRNPFAPDVPCHRVVNADGRLGGYCGKQNSPKKIRLLKKEGIYVRDGKIVDFKKKIVCILKK